MSSYESTVQQVLAARDSYPTLAERLTVPCPRNRDRHAGFFGIQARGKMEPCPQCGTTEYGEYRVPMPRPAGATDEQWDAMRLGLVEAAVEEQGWLLKVWPTSEGYGVELITEGYQFGRGNGPTRLAALCAAVAEAVREA